jgi:hypothetical protein
MSIPLIKSRIIVGDKYLGNLFYNKDSAGRGYLKFSFKNKIANFVKSTDIPNKFPTPLKLDVPISLEVSYKFKDRLLEIKKLVNKKTEREFYKISVPVQSCLFILRVKDYTLYDQYSKKENLLILDPPHNGNKSIAIIFSFLGEHGSPFTHPDYNCGLMGMIDLPENELSNLCIGIAEDTQEYGNQDIQILFPVNSI